MAEVKPLEAVHYELGMVGSLEDVTAPPYDVIGPEQRKELLARSPFNVVEVDLPEAPERRAIPYEHAAETLDELAAPGHPEARPRARDLGADAQEFTGPDGDDADTARVPRPGAASSTTDRAGCARTSGPSRGRRRTGCG